MKPSAFDPAVVDGAWLFAWLSGRSLARGIPLPFADRGGWRVESGTESERRRWVFASLSPELRALADSIADPALRLRAAVEGDAMLSHLPAGWTMGPPSFAMAGPRPTREPAAIPRGYRIETQAGGRSVHCFVLAPDGALAASGHAGMAEEAIVFDRIVTQPDHQRRGLGRAVMAALAHAGNAPALAPLLVATTAGRHLYESFGWRVVGPYASASWSGDSPVQN